MISAELAGRPLSDRRDRWDSRDVILYHLAIGAGRWPYGGSELDYVGTTGLRVLPTFGVTLMPRLVDELLRLPELAGARSEMLHGEHDLTLDGPLPVTGEMLTETRIDGVFDKGSGALVVLEARSSVDGRQTCTNRMSLFFRGHGGFGGERGDGDPVPTHEDRAPDRTVECATNSNQALLYRLTGDENPLHIDPAVAVAAGFERPILQGLCTFGIVAKAVSDWLPSGDRPTVGRYRARFTDVAYPGETLAVSIWSEAGTVFTETRSVERDGRMLSTGVIDPADNPKGEPNAAKAV